jgi:hypothetical protein
MKARCNSSKHEEDKGRSKTRISVTFSGGLRLFALLQPADLLRETIVDANAEFNNYGVGSS